MIDWQSAGFVALGGAAGSVLRYLIGVVMVARLGALFPWHTLAINIAGSFAIGIVMELGQTQALGVTPPARTFLAVGILGGFTTFSSFSYETLALLGRGAGGAALTYASGSVVLGVLAAFAGAAGARLAVR